MLERLAETAKELGVDVETRQADAESLPFPDGSFDLVLGPRRAAPPARARQGPGGVPPRAGSGRHAGVHGRAVAPRRPARRDAEAARGHGRAGVAPADGRGAKRPTAPAANPGRGDVGELEGLVDVHTFDARRVAASSRSERASPTCGCPGEELLANVYGWLLRRLEADVDPATVPLRLAPLRVPQLPDAAVGRRPAARAAAPGRALLQPAALGAQAGLSSGLSRRLHLPRMAAACTTSRCFPCRWCCFRARWCRCTSSRSATRRWSRCASTTAASSASSGCPTTASRRSAARRGSPRCSSRWRTGA